MYDDALIHQLVCLRRNNPPRCLADKMSLNTLVGSAWTQSIAGLLHTYRVCGSAAVGSFVVVMWTRGLNGMSLKHGADVIVLCIHPDFFSVARWRTVRTYWQR